MAVKQIAVRDPELLQALDDLATTAGLPPHLLLARLVREYLEVSEPWAHCVACGVPREGTADYARAHIRGPLCPVCRGCADFAIDQQEARAAGLPSLEQPEPYMWQKRGVP